jgi:hypothetical protein
MAQEWPADSSQVIQESDYHVGYPVAIVGMRKSMLVLGASDIPKLWDISGQLVSLLASMAAIVAIWLFAGFTFNWQVAWITALLFGIGRNFAVMGADVLSDSLALCFQIWAVVFAILATEALRRNSKSMVSWAVLVGLCSGVGYLVRPESLLMGILPIVIWLGCQLRWRKSWPLTFASITTTAMMTMACALPYMIAIGGISKKKCLGDLVHNFLFVVKTDSPGVFLAMTTYPRISGLQELVSELFESLHPVLGVAFCIWLITWISSKVFSKRFGISLPRRIRLFPNYLGGWFLCGVAIFTIPLVLGLYRHAGYLSHRHVLFLAAVMSPFAGAGVVIMIEWVKIILTKLGVSNRYHRLEFFTIILALGIGLFLHSLRPLHYGKSNHRQAGIHIGELSSQTQNHNILTNSSWVAHYARQKNQDAKISVLHQTWADKSTLEQEIKRSPVKYLVLADKSLTPKNKDDISSLLKRSVLVAGRSFRSSRRKKTYTISSYEINHSKLLLAD